MKRWWFLILGIVWIFSADMASSFYCFRLRDFFGFGGCSILKYLFVLIPAVVFFYLWIKDNEFIINKFRSLKNSASEQTEGYESQEQPKQEFYNSSRFWIITVIIILLILFSGIRPKIDNKSLHSFEYNPERSTTLPETVDTFNEVYIDFDNIFSKILFFNSCKGFQHIQIGRFLTEEGEGISKPNKYQPRFYGLKVKILTNRGFRGEHTYYLSYGIVLSGKSYLICA